jgi:hypothetical protein
VIVASAAAVALLMATAAGIGLLEPGIYRDNDLVRAGWLGNDVVTLLVVVPSLAWAIARARRGSARGLLVCMGLAAYAVYGYAFYLFGAAFNAAFLLYVAIVTAATVALILGLSSDVVGTLAARVEVRGSHRVVGAVVAAVAAALGLFWIGVSLSHGFSGEVPGMVSATNHPTNVTGALDLWLVTTFGLWGSLWLARGNGWGYIISAIWAVKGAYYMAALSAASVTAYRAGALASLGQLGLWAPMGVLCAISATILVRGLPPTARTSA